MRTTLTSYPFFLLCDSKFQTLLVYSTDFEMDCNLQIGQEIIAKFNVKNNPLYTKVLWKDDDKDLFHIKVFYECNTWTGKYSTELAEQRRERLDEDIEEYKTNVKNCLSEDIKDYIYDFTQSPDDVNSATFVWKKQYENALKIQGQVLLQRDEVPTSKDTLIDILLERNRYLVSEVELAKSKNYCLKQEHEQYLQRLNELTDSKTLLESTLYGRFVQVLNEKKRRIQLLEDQLKNI